MEHASAPAGKGGGNTWRALAVILLILLVVGCFIMLAAATDIAGTPTCHDVQARLAAPKDNSCFDGSQVQKVLSVAFGYASGAVGVIAALLAIAFTITGRRGRLLAILAVGAMVLAGISILVGSL